jgi:hypothetical protein
VAMNRGMMLRNAHIALCAILVAAFFAGSSYARVPSSDESFERTLSVSGPIRLELSGGSGNVQIKTGADGKVRIHGDVKPSWSLFGDARKRVAEIVANPPIEQRGNTIRIGKDGIRTRNLEISYIVEVPHDTEVSASVASGSLFVGGVRGPVKAESASGSVRAEKIDRDAQISSASGSVDASDIGDFLRVSDSSGNVTVSNVKGDIRISTASGDIRVTKLGGRVDASTASGSIEILGATSETKAHTVSGHITVQGDTGKSGYWELKSVSGNVDLTVPHSAAFYFSADSSSGTIRTDIPIIIEEQGKHSLRARLGNGGGRVEAHSVSGEIRVHAAS